MCQFNTFMINADFLDGEKICKISSIFEKVGYENFCEYSNPKLRNTEPNMRLFLSGSLCDCGSIITKRVVIDEEEEQKECNTLKHIISEILEQDIPEVCLFSHWYKGNNLNEKVCLEKNVVKVSLKDIKPDTFRNLFYDQTLKITK